jgi:hypothetical protein
MHYINTYNIKLRLLMYINYDYKIPLKLNIIRSTDNGYF